MTSRWVKSHFLGKHKSFINVDSESIKCRWTLVGGRWKHVWHRKSEERKFIFILKTCGKVFLRGMEEVWHRLPYSLLSLLNRKRKSLIELVLLHNFHFFSFFATLFLSRLKRTTFLIFSNCSSASMEIIKVKSRHKQSPRRKRGLDLKETLNILIIPPSSACERGDGSWVNY